MVRVSKVKVRILDIFFRVVGVIEGWKCRRGWCLWRIDRRG